MSHLVVAVFILHPFQHLAASVVVEVGIDIRKRNTVGVEETFEQQVVLDRVDLGDAKTIGHHRACSRATTRTHHNAKLLAGRVDKVLHYEEVAWETHGLHNVKLELHALVHLLRQWVAIEFLGSVVGKLGKIVGLKLDAVEFVDASKFFDFILCLLVRHNLVAIFVGCELAEEFFGRYAFAGVLLGAELCRDGEERHDGRMVDGIELHLI